MNPLSFVSTASSPATRVEPLQRRPGEDLRRTELDTRTERAGDTVEFSSEARQVALGAQEPRVREELVQRVRSEIAAGTYETPEKYLIALSRALGDVTLPT